MSGDLGNWKPRPRPERKTLAGRHVRLEPLSAARHGDGLYRASSTPDAAARFRHLFDHAPESRDALQPWLEMAEAAGDPLFFAVVDIASGEAAGRQALMRIEPVHGVIEIGSIYWGPLVARRPGATEAQYLFARYVFEELGYRRYEWKCDNLNEKSKRAAQRFGFAFEGVFRQHMVVKGKNRDTAWYSIVDGEWPALRKAYETWLDPANFDAEGRQRKRLEDCRADVRASIDA